MVADALRRSSVAVLPVVVACALACAGDTAVTPLPIRIAGDRISPIAITAASEDLSEHLYVANRGASSITAYDRSAAGDVHPLLTLGGSNTMLADPWAMAFDVKGTLYVQNYVSESRTDVYPSEASGNHTPTRVFGNNDGGRDAPSIAVDSKGNVYVARYEKPRIDVFPPGTTGSVAPSRIIMPDGFPQSVSIGPGDALIVAVAGSSAAGGNNAIEVFAHNASGSATPIRTIAGSKTGLGTGFAFGGDQIVATYSRFTGRIYVAVAACDMSAVTPHVSVFAATDMGNVAPIRTIAGSATGMHNPIVLSGIAGDQHDGSIYVMRSSCSIDRGRVLVFARFATGNAKPLRSFTDAATHFSDVVGIAVGP